MEEQKLTAEEIIEAWRKGRISASLRDGMLRAEGYELAKDADEADEEPVRWPGGHDEPDYA